MRLAALNTPAPITILIRGILNTVAASKIIVALSDGALGWFYSLDGGSVLGFFATATLQITAPPATTSLAVIPNVFGISYDGTTVDLSINGVVVDSGARVVSPNLVAGLVLGNFSGTDAADFSFHSLKIWQRALTAPQTLVEAGVDRPVDTANLYDYWPSLSAATLVGALGHTLVESGTLSDVTPLSETYTAAGSGGGGGGGGGVGSHSLGARAGLTIG